MACLDTSALIDLMNRGGRARLLQIQAVVRNLPDSDLPLVTTRLNLAELYVGIERAADRGREFDDVERVTRRLLILEFDDAAAWTFGQVQAHLLKRGEPIGDMDGLIASVVLTNRQALISHDAPHFSRVPGLRLISYGNR